MSADWYLFVFASLVVLGTVIGVFSLKDPKDELGKVRDASKAILGRHEAENGLKTSSLADLTITYLLGKLGWCSEKISKGARVFAMLMQRCEIPASLLPADKEADLQNVLLLVLEDPEGKEVELVECVLYNTMDKKLADVFAGKDVIELVV